MKHPDSLNCIPVVWLSILDHPLTAWGKGRFIGGHQFFTKTFGGESFFNSIFWQGHQFVDKICMIYSYFNFLNGLKIMFKHYWGGGVKKAFKISNIEQRYQFFTKTKWGHAYFNKFIWVVGEGQFVNRQNSKSPPPLAVNYEWCQRWRIHSHLRSLPKSEMRIDSFTVSFEINTQLSNIWYIYSSL